MLKTIIAAIAFSALIVPVAIAKDHDKGEHHEGGKSEHREKAEHHDNDRGEHRHHRQDHRGWYHCGGIWVPILGIGCDYDD
jgi:Ni/Co efflux regulator RcnB